MKWVVPRGDEQGARLDEFHPESQIRLVMTPSNYLELCHRLWKGQEREVAYDDRMGEIRTRLLEELPLDCAYLDVNIETWQVMAQEGRHRAIVAAELGILEMPVILFGRSPKGWFVDEETHPGFASQLLSRFGGLGVREL
jgi:hypothetical protein